MKGVLLVIAFAALLLAALWLLQERLIFFPQPLVSPSHIPPEAVPSVADTGFKRSSHWLAFFGRALLPAGLFALALLGLMATSSKAQANGGANVNAQSKLARDLQAGIAVANTPTVNWARDIKGARYLQMIGIAPNAKIYDVRVLDDHGYGTVSDAIEGIQWVIYHAKEYNIRVLNTGMPRRPVDR